MVESIIGNYLVECGKITPKQLNETMDKMDAVRVKLGLIAVSEGLMTFAQAEEVNRLQAACDKRFGDIAVEKGFLTDAQVGRLLKRQGDAYLAFIQVLEDGGLVTLEEVGELLEKFRSERGLTNSEIEIIKSDDVEGIVEILLPAQAKDYCALVSIAMKTLIRLVDRHANIRGAKIGQLKEAGACAFQELQGKEIRYFNGFRENTGALLTAASFFGQEDFESLDEDALDAAAELMNCINGLFASSQSDFLELMPPVYGVQGAQVPEGEACVVTIQIGDKVCEFVSAKLGQED